jgi:ribonuclease Z
MKKSFAYFVVTACILTLAAAAHAAPCMIVTLTGTQGGPTAFGGLAGAGTLVRYGDDSDEGGGCNAVKLQFDAGRGTSMRLSQIPVAANQLHAIFFTHLHSDHVDGLADLLQIRWHFNSKGPKVDIVCSADANAGAYTMSCQKLVRHIGDAYLQSGEIAQRGVEDKARLTGGPAAAANVQTFEPKDDAQVVWSRGDVKVSAIRSTHIAGHASYRVDTPAGSVVIGGDAGNDTPAPPRATSASAQVEKLAKSPSGADIIVHSAIHPVMGPDKDSGLPAPIYYRQSTATDLGAMAQRAGAKHLMLTHLIPSLGSRSQGPYRVPGGALTEEDYKKAAEAGGFAGNIVVGTDLVSVRLPAK